MRSSMFCAVVATAAFLVAAQMVGLSSGEDDPPSSQPVMAKLVRAPFTIAQLQR